MLKRLLALTGAVAIVVGLAAPVLAAPDGPVRLGARMAGHREVPGPGDPDGRGRARFKVNASAEKLCYEMEVINLSEIVGGHIHLGQVDESGPIVVDLNVVENGGTGCVHAGRATLVNIARYPQNFYVNIHTTEYPAGAIRDQLSQRA